MSVNFVSVLTSCRMCCKQAKLAATCWGGTLVETFMIDRLKGAINQFNGQVLQETFSEADSFLNVML